MYPIGMLGRSPRRSPLEVLGQASAWRAIVEDFRPLCESLEWRLADAHWVTRGVASFVEKKVPYLVNNDGRLSADVAAVLLASCLERPLENGAITVLEVGAGTGLFARYVLDEFQALCRAEGRDFYERLTYVITDRSPATVEFWTANGIFANHAGRVRLQVADAAPPVSAADGPLHAVFCNYVLDTLAGSTLRRSATGWEQLCVRTWIDDDAERLRQHTTLGFDEVRDRVLCGHLAELLPALPLLEGEHAFLPLPPGAFPELDPLKSVEIGQVFAYNHAALQFLEAVLTRLEPEGFVLVNDYGAARPEQRAQFAAGQWFGPVCAMGLDFALLEQTLRQRTACGPRGPVHVLTPEGDEGLLIHSRLIHREPQPGYCRVYLDRFAAARRQHSEALDSNARSAAASGRRKEALEAFRTAIEGNPRNWRLLGEVAEFAARQLRDHRLAIELAQAGLDLNPWYSAWLWNVLGESLAGAGRHDEAHQCHLHAERIHPNDPKTQSNLAESWLRQGSPERSLQAIANGLAHDSDSMHRHVLLARQQAAIAALALRWTRERESAARKQESPLQ
jgi:tetratricopeptide (TPR) repeat protein